jgi:hypothetical protein
VTSTEGDWAQSDRILLISPTQPLYADVPEDRCEVATENENEDIRSNCEGWFGDRRKAIVFIGTALKQRRGGRIPGYMLVDIHRVLSRHILSNVAQCHDILREWSTPYQTPNSVFNLTPDASSRTGAPVRRGRRSDDVNPKSGARVGTKSRGEFAHSREG